jgi:WD40 repeat protein
VPPPISTRRVGVRAGAEAVRARIGEQRRHRPGVPGPQRGPDGDHGRAHNPVAQVSFSPDGTRIVTASLDGTARVWKLETGAPLATLAGHRGPVTAAEFTDDSDVVTGGEDGTVRLWYVLAEPELQVLAQLPGPVTRAAFLSPGRIEAVTRDGRGHVFDLAGHQLAVRAATPVRPAVSVLGATATRSGSTVLIREPGGKTVVLRGHTGPVSSVRFSPDGGTVVTASRDGTARIWDAAPGRRSTSSEGISASSRTHRSAPTGAGSSPPARAPRPCGRPPRATASSTSGATRAR